jgi:hypothetical protein
MQAYIAGFESRLATRTVRERNLVSAPAAI